MINQIVNKKHIKYNSHDADTSRIEGILARGDRRLNDVLLKVYQAGAMFESWSEYFDVERWDNAFDELGINSAFYNERVREYDELLPWEFINIGVTKKFLWKEFEKATSEQTTINCMEGCTNCGAMVYGGGICYER